MKVTKVSDSIEKQILIGLITSESFIKKILPTIDFKLFDSTDCKLISRWCADYFNKYNTVPGRNIESIFAEKTEGLKAEQKKRIKTFLFSINKDYEELGFNEDYVFDRTIRYFRKQKIELNLHKISTLLDNDELEEAEDICFNMKPIEIPTNGEDEGFTAKELQTMDVPKIKWVIKGVIPEGLTLFAGKPKTGKSYFVLNAAIDLASGGTAFGNITVKRSRTVLYLALEDPKARLQDRLVKILGEDNKWPQELYLHPMGSWPRIHEGGLQRLEKWMEDHPLTRLIIIDVLEKFRKPQRYSGYSYSEDYKALSELHEFAGKHNIGLVVVHHTRKTKSEDVFDEISGTTGLAGVPDTLAVLSRINTGTADRVYSYRGRNVGESEIAFKFKGFRWIKKGNASKYKHSVQRQVIIDYLEKQGKPIERKELYEAVKDKIGKGVDVLIRALVDNGDIEKVERGKYAPKGYASNVIVGDFRNKMRMRKKRKLITI